MRHRTVKNCLVAADIYEDAAGAAADPSLLRLKAADALVSAMRIYGNANLMVVDGSLDTPDNKRFWAKHAPRALSLARQVEPPLRDESWAAFTEMESFMYGSASKGIVQQAVTGAGFEFRRLAEALVADHGVWDSHAAHGFLGGFFAVAPWPVGDKKRAMKELLAGQARSPGSRRNNYHLCVVQMQSGDIAAAVQTCEAALAAKCLGTEVDACDFMSSEIDRILSLARAA